MGLLSRKSSEANHESPASTPPSAPSATKHIKRACYSKPTHEAASSDLIVRCRDADYHVHRDIMSSHSQWFAKVCAKACTGTATQCVDLSAHGPDAVGAMVQYCYRHDYTDNFLSLSSAGYLIYIPNPHIDIYVLAERFGISGLKLLAAEKFSTRAAALSQAESNKDRFFQTIGAIYTSTSSFGKDDCLRRIGVKLCADHSEQCVLSGWHATARIFKLMDEVPAFRLDLISELALRVK